MKFNFRFCLAAMLVVSSLSSCVTKFTAAEREALNQGVTIMPTGMESNAYSRPYAGSASMRQAAGQAGIQSNGGAVGGALGALVGEAVAATQNGMFHNSNGKHVAIVEKNTPRDVNRSLEMALNRHMKNDPFFGPRLKPSSPNRLTSTVSSYGLVRYEGGKKDGQLCFIPILTTKIELTGADGKKLAGGYYTGVGLTPRTIAEYANHPAVLRSDFKQAAEVAAFSFHDGVTRKAAP